MRLAAALEAEGLRAPLPGKPLAPADEFACSTPSPSRQMLARIDRQALDAIAAGVIFLGTAPGIPVSFLWGRFRPTLSWYFFLKHHGPVRTCPSCCCGRP